MKLLNVSGAPLTGAVYAEARRLLRTGKKASAVPGADGVLYALIVKGDRVLVVNGKLFQIISADGTTVRWSGGIPPFTVSVEEGDLPATFVNVDQSVYTLSEREFSVLTRHQKDLVDDDYDWWAANDELVNGEAVQTSAGVIIEDSSEPPRRIFAPFGGIQGVYDHFGPQTWCVPIIVWVVPQNGTYGGVAMTLAQVFVPGDDTTPLPGSFIYDPPLGTILNAGVHTVSVTFQADDELHYREAVETRTVTVAKATQIISGFAVNGDGYFTSAYTLSGVASSGLPLTFICYASEVVINYGTSPPTITFPQPGTYTIYATQSGDGNYEMAPQQEITRFITSHMPNANMTVEAPYGFVVGKAVIYHDTTPTHPDGATITLSWAVTQRPTGSVAQLSFWDDVHPEHTDGTAPGSYAGIYPDVGGAYTVQMTATDQWGVSRSASNTFTVTAQAQTIAFTLSATSIIDGDTAAITITNSGAGTGSITFASSNTAVATVSGTTVTGVGVGSCTITMTKAADAAYLQATYSVSVNVISATPPLTYSILNTTTLQISGGVAPYSWAVSPPASTGGLSFVHIGGNQVQTSNAPSGCYCAGAGLRITDSAGHSVTAPFGVGGYLQYTILCTSGCPSGGGDPEWGDPVWVTTRTGGPSYFNEMTYGWFWVHWINNGTGACQSPYPGGSVYPPQAQTGYEPWTLYPETAVSLDGNYKIEFAYYEGVVMTDAEINDIPGHSLAEVNAQTGLNFSIASFGLCAAYSYLRIKKLYAK